MSDAEPRDQADILAKAEHIYCEFTALMERLRAQAREESSASPDASPPEDLMRPGDATHEIRHIAIDTASSLS